MEPKINEFVANPIGTDTQEFVEIFGTPNYDYNSYTILEIEGDSGYGVIDRAFQPGITDSNGLYSVSFPALENGTVTLLLVKDFSGTTGMDIDTNDDGVIDNILWSMISDTVVVHDGGTADKYYGQPVLGPNFDGITFTPGGASRIPDGHDTELSSDWVRNDYDGEGLPGFVGTPDPGEAFNTPGLPNRIVPFVTFNVTVPDYTPGTVYVIGSEDALGAWAGTGVALTQVDATHWTKSIYIPAAAELAFKFTRGSWDTVMKGEDGNTELSDLTLVYTADGAQEYNYTVLNWRDPIVTAVVPANGAVDVAVDTSVAVTWNQSVAAGSCFTLTDGVNPVAGSCAYDDATRTITFTPSAPLTGLTAYTVNVTGVLDTEVTPITQQVPFSSTFTTVGP